jgi:hypothetical protein
MVTFSKALIKGFVKWVFAGAMMGCLPYCRYPHTTWRPHWSCLYCRIRRWFYGKLDHKIWHYNKRLNVVLPIGVRPDVLFLDEKTIYCVWRDPNRKFKAAKQVLFNKLFSIIKKMEFRPGVKPGVNYPNGLYFIRKNLVTFLEMLAN